MTAVLIYLGTSLAFILAVLVALRSKNPPKWLVDDKPHDKYDEPN